MKGDHRRRLAATTRVCSLDLVVVVVILTVMCLGRYAQAYGVNQVSASSPLTRLSGGVFDWPNGQFDGRDFVRIGPGRCRLYPKTASEIAPNICAERPNDDRTGLAKQYSDGGLRRQAPDSPVSKLMVAQSRYLSVAAPEEKLPPLSCSEQFESLLSGQVLRFEFDSLTINPNGMRILDRLVQFIDACPESRIEIAGHTDSLGTKGFNRKLSRRRAKAVVDYLISEGVRKGQLKAVGYGESKPIAANDTPKGQARNRRVEFKYLQEGS